MQRVVITGMGIVSCLGNNQQEVLESLKVGKSGIRTDQSHIDKQFRSQISGVPQIDLDALIDRKLKRFMGDGAAYAYLSMKEAIEQAGLTPEQVSSVRTGLIVSGASRREAQSPSAVRSAAISSLQSLMMCTHLALSSSRRQNAFTPCMFSSRSVS